MKKEIQITKKLHDFLVENNALDQFINNAKILQKLILNDNPYSDICSAFDWNKTNEGFLFWSNLDNEASKKGILIRLILTNEEIINLINLSK